MTEEFSFPLERTPAMKILGVLWTGSVSGQILVGALLLIGVGFMGNMAFSPISIIFFVVFIIPFSIILHLRLVSKGKKLMGEWCDMKYYPESNTLQFKTGFPNTMNPEWQEVEITEDNNTIIIKGGEIGGYHLRVGEAGSPDTATRLGLWVNLSDAEKAANKLAELFGGEIKVDISGSEEDENEDDSK